MSFHPSTVSTGTILSKRFFFNLTLMLYYPKNFLNLFSYFFAHKYKLTPLVNLLYVSLSVKGALLKTLDL